MLIVHRNPHGVGLPFRRPLLPLASMAERSLPAWIAAAQRRDPKGLILVATLLDETLPDLLCFSPASTSTYASSANDRARAVSASFRMADAWHTTDLLGDAAERLVFRGLDLAAALRWEAHYPLLAAVDFVQRIEAAIDEHGPTSITALGNADYVRLAGLIARHRGLPFHAVPFRLADLAQRFVSDAAAHRRMWPRGPTRRQPSNQSTEEVALLVANGRGSALNALAVAAELAKRGSLAPVLGMHQGPAATAFAGASFPTADLDTWGVPRPYAVTVPELRRVRGAWPQIEAAPGIETVFQHDEIPLWEPWGRDLVRKLVLRRCPEAMQAIATAEAVLAAYRPRVVAVGFDPGLPNRAMTGAARRFGIPTVSIQDGVFLDAAVMGLAADTLCAESQVALRAFTQGGVAANRIHVTGQPRLDRLQRQADDADGVREALGITKREKVALLFASTGEDSAANASQKEQDETAVVAFFSGRPDWRLLLKLHPHGDAAISRRVVQRHAKGNVELLREPDSQVLVRASDVIICTTATTAAMEAILADKPLLILNFNRESPMADLVTAGVARYVRHPADLERELWAVLGESEARSAARAAYMEAQMAPQAGTASARVADVLERLAGRSPK